jgi:hypothetical protein
MILLIGIAIAVFSGVCMALSLTNPSKAQSRINARFADFAFAMVIILFGFYYFVGPSHINPSDVRAAVQDGAGVFFHEVGR